MCYNLFWTVFVRLYHFVFIWGYTHLASHMMERQNTVTLYCIKLYFSKCHIQLEDCCLLLLEGLFFPLAYFVKPDFWHCVKNPTQFAPVVTPRFFSFLYSIQYKDIQGQKALWKPHINCMHFYFYFLHRSLSLCKLYKPNKYKVHQIISS